MPRRARALACAALASAAAVASDPVHAPWPALPAQSQRLALKAARPLQVPIQDAQGRLAYLLECHEEAAAIVHCSLRDARRPADASLLARAGLRDRGAFRVRDLQGACASYPQFGRQRSFRLRGFELSLALVDLPPGAGGGPPAHALQLDVQPDPLASTSEAEPPQAPDPESPGHSCQAPPPAADPFACRKPEVEITKPACTQ